MFADHLEILSSYRCSYPGTFPPAYVQRRGNNGLVLYKNVEDKIGDIFIRITNTFLYSKYYSLTYS